MVHITVMPHQRAERVEKGSPPQTAESPHCLGNTTPSPLQRASLSPCASFGKNILHPATYTASLHHS
jgi:hypothetical protein